MESPATVLLESLADARRRGERFEEAWSPAVGVALAVANANERHAWLDALADTRESWQRSFERQPAARRELAVLALIDDSREPARDRECARCGREISEDRDRKGARGYCSHECKIEANRAQERVAA